MIDIELIVGTMGLPAIQSGKIPKFSQAQLNRAASTLKSFRTGADTFVESNKPVKLPAEDWVSLKDLDKMYEDLEDPMATDNEHLETWPLEMQMPLLIQFMDCRVFLSENLPARPYGGMIAAQVLPPPDSDLYRLAWQAGLLDDIRRFSDLLNSGGITPLESELMRTLFPETHDYLLVELLDRITTAVADGKTESWDGSWRAPALAAFTGVPVASFQDVMQMQTGMAQKTAGRPKGAGSLQVAKLSLTGAQAIEARTLDRSKL